MHMESHYLHLRIRLRNNHGGLDTELCRIASSSPLSGYVLAFCASYHLTLLVGFFEAGIFPGCLYLISM